MALREISFWSSYPQWLVHITMFFYSSIWCRKANSPSIRSNLGFNILLWYNLNHRLSDHWKDSSTTWTTDRVRYVDTYQELSSSSFLLNACLRWFRHIHRMTLISLSEFSQLGREPMVGPHLVGWLVGWTDGWIVGLCKVTNNSFFTYRFI